MTSVFQSVLGAVDLDTHTRVVMYHAAGIAAATGARLTLVSATERESDRSSRESALRETFSAAIPLGAVQVPEPEFLAVAGRPVDVILAAAEDAGADVIVAGSHARAGLARLLLGSTSQALLERTTRPVMVIPPADLEIVTLGLDHIAFHSGPVLAAVDLEAAEHDHLQLASQVAALARQHLLLVTIAPAALTDHEAARELRARGRDLEPQKPYAVIVRRGNAAEELVRCADLEDSGLLVLSLPPEEAQETGPASTAARRGSRAAACAIATGVLQAGKAVVLAVPGQ